MAAQGLATPFPELIVRAARRIVYDAIRDTAADLNVPLRALRSRAHSLEEVYLDAVGAAALDPDPSEARSHGD